MTASSLRGGTAALAHKVGGFPGLRRLMYLGVLMAFAAPLAMVGCNNVAKNKEQKPVEVIVTTPITDEIVDYQDFTGRLDAFHSADIKARVTGFINEMDKPFKEGDRVRKGQLLFQIDPKQFEADLNLAEADMRVAEADAALQDKNAVRARRLVDTNGAISKEDYDTIMATLEKSKETVSRMKAARDKAKVYLDYTRVTAPFDGRVSRRYVDPGNDVTADVTLLTSLVSESPIYAYFDVDERTYQELKRTTGPVPSAGLIPILQTKVLMRLANEDKYEHIGVVNFIDNRVSATTGTIRMRAVFENPKGDLTPGLFARVRMPTGKPYTAFLIPDEALQNDQGRKYLYIVNADNEVEYREVELGQAIDSLRVIKKGLSEADHVIITGMQRVRAKQKVEPTKQDPPKRPESPLVKLTRKDEG